MSTTILAHWSLVDGRRVVATEEESTIEVRRAHKAYTIIRPDDIVPKLQRDGFLVTALQSHFTGRGTAVINVEQPDLVRNGYKGQCRILLNHRGTASVKLARGAARLICANEFYRPFMTIHHCSQDARDFLENPSEFVWETLRGWETTMSAVESLRQYTDWRAVDRVLKGMRLFRPSLYRGLKRGMWRRSYPISPWGIVQGATESKRPGLIRLANKWLNGAYRAALVDSTALVPLDMFNPANN